MCTLILAGLTLNAHATLVVPAGLSPGEDYHVIFVTSGTTDALSSDIATYDAFAQAHADAAGIGTSIGVDWLAIVSTSSVSARTHLANLLGSGAPIYNQWGWKISDTQDLFSRSHLNSIRFDEYRGTSVTAAWTGTDQGGDAFFELGTSYISPGVCCVTAGDPWSTTQWLDLRTFSVTDELPVYAISSLVTVSAVPLPAAVWLFGSGLLSLVGMARRKKAA